MRTLKFIADAQKLIPDSSCDFSGLVKGTRGYLRAEFIFSKDFAGCGKIAVFNCMGEDYPVKLEQDACIIPEKALVWKRFTVRAIGVKEGYRIQTNFVEVRQDD